MNTLSELIEELEARVECLNKARGLFLKHEAITERGEALLISQAQGSSNAEKVMNAKASNEWNQIQLDYRKAQWLYENEKSKFSVLEKKWQTAYLDAKLNERVIKKEQ